MLRIDFSEDEIAQLRAERYHHPHPRVRRKMSVLYLKSQGLPHKEIKRLEQISENTLLGYLRAYQAGGIERLKEQRFHSPVSELEQHRTTLERYFQEHPPASVKEAAAKIEELTGIKRSPERVRQFMKRIGLKLRRVGMIPAKADVEAQARFVDDSLEPRLVEARAGERALFLSMPRTLSSLPFLVCCGLSLVCLSRHHPVVSASMCWVL